MGISCFVSCGRYPEWIFRAQADPGCQVEHLGEGFRLYRLLGLRVVLGLIKSRVIDAHTDPKPQALNPSFKS